MTCFFFLRHLFHRHWSEGGRLLALRRGDFQNGEGRHRCGRWRPRVAPAGSRWRPAGLCSSKELPSGVCKRQARPPGGQGGGSRLGRGEAVDKGLGLNAPAPADFQPHNDKTAAALGCKLKVDRDAFAPRSLGDGGCGGGGSMGVCRAIPANGANKGCVNRKLCAVPKGEALFLTKNTTRTQGF